MRSGSHSCKIYVHTILKTREANDESVSEEKSKSPVPQKLENPTALQNMLESTSVFRRRFKIVGQIGHPNEKDKLSFTFLTRQVDSGLKQGYSEQEIVDGVIHAISAGMVLWKLLRSYPGSDCERFFETITVLRIRPNYTKALHRYAKDQKSHHKNSLCRFTTENSVFKYSRSRWGHFGL